MPFYSFLFFRQRKSLKKTTKGLQTMSQPVMKAMTLLLCMVNGWLPRHPIQLTADHKQPTWTAHKPKKTTIDNHQSSLTNIRPKINPVIKPTAGITINFLSCDWIRWCIVCLIHIVIHFLISYIFELDALTSNSKSDVRLSQIK